MTSLKLTKIGTSTGCDFGEGNEFRLKSEKGDTLYAIETKAT